MCLHNVQLHLKRTFGHNVMRYFARLVITAKYKHFLGIHERSQGFRKSVFVLLYRLVSFVLYIHIHWLLLRMSCCL